MLLFAPALQALTAGTHFRWSVSDPHAAEVISTFPTMDTITYSKYGLPMLLLSNVLLAAGDDRLTK